jgi:hypothetical protein
MIVIAIIILCLALALLACFGALWYLQYTDHDKIINEGEHAWKDVAHKRLTKM